VISKVLFHHWTATLQELIGAWALQRGCDLVISEDAHPPAERRSGLWKPG